MTPGITTGGGCTGASRRGGISVRGATGAGGVDVGGCPSASRNLRTRSASDSVGVLRPCGGLGGANGVDVLSDWFLPALLSAFDSS